MGGSVAQKKFLGSCLHVYTRIYTEHLSRKDAEGRGDLWAHRTESRCPNL